MKQYTDIPAKVLRANVFELNGTEYWPYDNGNDPYWRGGTSPKFYRWKIKVSVSAQYHSSPKTRMPNGYTGTDVHIGDYLADTISGTALKIIEITSKTDDEVECIVEDVYRYNTFRDGSGTGNGIFALNSDVLIFELNEEAQPVVETNSEVSQNFYNNLSSRFQNIEESFNFVLNKTAHGFKFKDLIAADPNNQTFVLASPANPFLIGTVTDLDIGPDAFAINPFQKIVDNFNTLIGNAASIIYSDDDNAGRYSLSGNHPIMIKLREESQTICNGSVAAPTTTAGFEFIINGHTVTLATGDVAGFLNDVNALQGNTGVVASNYEKETVAIPNTAPAGIMVIPAAATINGVLVNFVTDTAGAVAAGSPGYANMYDLVSDINAAAIPNLKADVFAGEFGDSLRLTETNSGDIVIVNVTSDGWGNPVAGVGSTTGLPLTTMATGDLYVRLTAIDARAIDLLDVTGSPTQDFGLISAENGTKAAALYIEQGIRQASTYVVTNIAGRDSLSALYGDQCFVQDTGNGEWAYYIYTLDSTWVKLSDKDSSETDAQSVEVEITWDGPTEGFIHSISPGRRVSFVTVTVTEAFNTPATVSVGDDDVTNRLMTADQNDLSSMSDYSTTPAYTYSVNTDTEIKFYFTPVGATQGRATVAITYT